MLLSSRSAREGFVSSNSSANCVFLWVGGAHAAGGVKGWGRATRVMAIRGLNRGGGQRCGLNVRVNNNSKSNNDDNNMLVSCFSLLLY